MRPKQLGGLTLCGGGRPGEAIFTAQAGTRHVEVTLDVNQLMEIRQWIADFVFETAGLPPGTMEPPPPRSENSEGV
jgi:hypothetical protein